MNKNIVTYILKRLMLMVPTLLGIMFVNFMVIQAAPGGPIEQIMARLRHQGSDVDLRMGGGGDTFSHGSDHTAESTYRGSQGIDPAFIQDLEQQFGFDKPMLERFGVLVKNYISFDLGKSYFRETAVTQMIAEKLPVSISLGAWTTFFVYLISLPLGISKAHREGSRFDIWTSALVIVAYAIPSFLLALFLIVLFSGGSCFQVFPLRGLYSEHWDTLSWGQKIGDYLWHITLPVLSMVIGGFAKLTLLTKNSFLEELSKPYVLTARAKGSHMKRVLYGHVFRNAMLVVIAGFPAAFVGILFTSSLLIEVLFSLDGLGLLGFEAALNRDYPVMFGTLYVFTLVGLILHLISDILYMFIDPRINLSESRKQQ